MYDSGVTSGKHLVLVEPMSLKNSGTSLLTWVEDFEGTPRMKGISQLSLRKAERHCSGCLISKERCFSGFFFFLKDVC